MKKHIALSLLLGLYGLWGMAQAPINVLAGRFLVGGSNSFETKLAFAEGDTVLFSYATEKAYSLVSISSSNYKDVYTAEKTDSLRGFKFVVPCNQVYNFKFVGRKMTSRWIDLDIKRIPASGATRYYNTAVSKITLRDTRPVPVLVDSVVRTDKKTEVRIVNVFDRYLYQNVPMSDESFQLLAIMGGERAVKQLSFRKPTPPPVPNARLKYWSYTISSKLGGAKHWQMAEIGASVAMSFACPAAGVATSMLMDRMGPQEGGEPTSFIMSWDKRTADIITKKYGRWDQSDNVSVYKGGSFTSIYGIAAAEKDMYAVMNNPSMAKAKNVKMEVSALYYAPYYRKVKAKEITVSPVVERVSKVMDITTGTVQYVSAK